MNTNFTPEELVALVHRYYPANLHGDDEAYRQSVEFQSLVSLREEAARDQEARWYPFVDRVKHLLLPDYIVWDLTYLRHDNCHRLRVYLPGTTRETTEHKAIMACVSILAPVHILYSSFEERVNGRRRSSQKFYEPRPETRHLEEMLDPLIHSMLGTTRLPNDVLFTPVPDIQCGNVPLGKATLADCLFTDDRW